MACTFTAASLAAYQVYGAVCVQEAAAQRALGSYARFAAWTFAREASAELERGAHRVLGPAALLGSTRANREPAGPSALVAEGIRAARECQCGTVPDVRFTFAVDIDAGKVVVGTVGDEIPEMPGASVEAAIIARLREGRARGEVIGDPTVARLSADTTLAIAYTLIGGGSNGAHPGGAPRAAYGFAFDVAAASRAIFPAILATRALLPPSPATAMPVDSALALTVSGPDGRVVFRSASAHGSQPEARLSMGGAFGGFVIHAAMRPAFASRVVVGNWTWNRSQFVLGLITLSAGLVIVSLLQLHRERQLARLKSEFVSNVSHELRTPLAQIRMFAEMLRLGWVRSDDERQRSVAVIDQEARRLAHLVENILQFSGAERSTPHVALEPLELATLVDEVVDGFAPLARARGAIVQTTHSGAVVVRADRDALRQVLLNLLDNAVKYGPVGQTITVGTSVSGPARARVWVNDEGAGIPARDKARIWEPFRRLDRAVESAVAGNGIGLAVVKELVLAQGGHVDVDDAPGGGASFVVTLQTAPPDESGAASDEGDAREGHASAVRTPAHMRRTRPASHA